MKYWCDGCGAIGWDMIGAPARCFNACMFVIPLLGGCAGGAPFDDELDAIEPVLFLFALDFFDPLVCF